MRGNGRQRCRIYRCPTVLEIMRPLIIRNVQTDPRTQDILFFRRNGLVSFLGLPVTAGGDSLGILCVYTKDEHQFTDEEVAFFNTLAGQAAMPFKAPIYSRRSAPATRGYGIFSSIAGRCKKRIAATLLGNSTMKLAKF